MKGVCVYVESEKTAKKKQNNRLNLAQIVKTRLAQVDFLCKPVFSKLFLLVFA